MGGLRGQAVATVFSTHHQLCSLLLPGIALPRAHQPPGPILPSRVLLTSEDALGSWGWGHPDPEASSSSGPGLEGPACSSGRPVLPQAASKLLHLSGPQTCRL